MAVKTTLYNALLAAYTQAESEELTKEQFADLMSTAIDDYIRTFLVQKGIAVQVSVSTGTGATTGTGTLA